ncbi:MAG: hypothetical protein M1827_003138 [Pycnora praestabilis]|nr:MAG: hypothetical protein M1827_003138 [Pycnora praestabilis]
MAASSQYIFLTGAPNASSLIWHDEASSLDSFLPAVTRFVEGRTDNERTPAIRIEHPSSESRPSWRHVPFKRKHLSTGISQKLIRVLDPEEYGIDADYVNTGKEEIETSFFTTTELSDSFSTANGLSELEGESSLKNEEDTLSQFYEHSYAIHEDVPSSQIEMPLDPVSQKPLDTSQSGDTSSPTTTPDASTFITSSSTPDPIRALPTSTLGHLSDVEDIPNANYLHSITPQTMTVNLIVGIISIPPPRIIKTRRGGREMEIIEMLVGDETKAGFGINFWLRPCNSQAAHRNLTDALKSSLGRLRPQDIILVRNVALSTFRGKVYGQSLRKNMTKLDLLYRNVINEDDEHGGYRCDDLTLGEHAHPQVMKVAKVRDWVMRFIGPSARGYVVEDGHQHARSRPAWQGDGPVVLPPDTQ